MTSSLMCYSGGYTVTNQSPEYDVEPDLQTVLEELTRRVEALEVLMAEDPAKPDPKESHGVNLAVRRAAKVIKPRAPKLIPAGVVNGKRVSLRVAPH